MNSTTAHLTPQDRTSIALSNHAQRGFLSSIPKLSAREIMEHYDALHRNNPHANSEDLVQMVVETTRATRREVHDALFAEVHRQLPQS